MRSCPTSKQLEVGGLPNRALLGETDAPPGAEFGDSSTYITYRNLLIIAVLGVPGALMGAFLIELPHFGRRGALACSTALTGVFLYASTTATTSSALLGWNCGYNFMSNIMYAVLYCMVRASPLRFRITFLRPSDSGDLPDQGSWHGQRSHRDGEPHLRYHGSDSSDVCEPGDLRAGVCERGVVHCGWGVGASAPF